MADYISQVDLADRPSLVYSNNDIKAAKTGGGFNVLHLISLPIVHTNHFLACDTRQDLDVTIAEAEVVHSPSLNTLSMIMSNYKAKEEMFWSKLLLADVQDFLSVYQNYKNKDDYLKNY